ncbi:MAG: hypoxanthine phosphoribosyltransferase [Oscillospiraceae bacterium]|nr:hypoxanthine phosphoribosyltransferase [Oscillospiraceae bacterium]
MNRDFKNILFSEERIKERVVQLGAEITRDYSGKSPMLIGVLKGSFVFLADLARSIDLDCEIRFLSCSSYGSSTVTTGEVNIKEPLDFDVRQIAGRDVLLVEDIIDSGVTMVELREFFSEFSPASLKICTLLDKVSRREVPIKADYAGFICPDEFVVGYGLDYAEKYRNLPHIAALEPETCSG